MYDDYATLFLSAKPGMTGHWQVKGRGDLHEYAKRVELDPEYSRDQSVGKDIEILLLTGLSYEARVLLEGVELWFRAFCVPEWVISKRA